ncbi:MAG: HAMP domain-containing protein [Deltaproteobacteria bacterium]|nr:HAMP domain-containing protein [Deltaproteobacteria bacterium]
MRLTAKLSLALSLAILLVLGAHAFVRVRREVQLFERDMRRDHHLLGRTVAGAAARAWLTAGEPAALDVVRDANERESNVTIRWVRPDAPADSPLRPRVEIDLIWSNARFEVRRGDEEDVETLYTYVPVGLPSGEPAAVEIAESLDVERDYVKGSIRNSAIATAVLFLLCSAIALGLGAYFVGRPVRRLVEQARRIGSGDFEARIDLRQHDEIGQPASEMNSMSRRLAASRDHLEVEARARIQAVEQLRHADRLMTVGKLAAGIAHEMGTPLNVITGYAELIGQDFPPGSAGHEGARVIRQQADRLAGIIRQLLDFARQRSPRRTAVDVRTVVRRTVALLRPMAEKQGISVELVEPSSEVTAEIDAFQFDQLLSNLVVNAIQATHPGGAVTIGLETGSYRGGAGPERSAEVRLFVLDDGVGIPEENKARIFEPFFTTKEPGEGTGLGLPVAHGIVSEHGGWIEVTSQLGQGSCFSIYVPRSASS